MTKKKNDNIAGGLLFLLFILIVLPMLKEIHNRSELNSFFCSGNGIQIERSGKKAHVLVDEMSAFHKITFGIPISIRKETLTGLTAVTGIGPKIAGAIIRERTKRGGFQKLDDLLSVPGISPSLYKKISPYLAL